MTCVLSVFLFALACNLDTLTLAVGFGARGIPPSLKRDLTLAGVTTLITTLAVCLGALGGDRFPEALTDRGGGLILIGMGLWTLLDWLRSLGQTEEMTAQGDYLALAAVLALNNAGAGLAAGVGGLSPVWSGGANFLVSLLFLSLGIRLGGKLRDGRLSRLALPLSGVLLVLLGLLCQKKGLYV